MSAGFTPGPWEVHSGYLIRKCEGDYCFPIAEMRAPYRKNVGLVRGHKQEWHNAHLIASAPALYAACETARAVISAEPFWATDPDLAATFDLLTSALAQARGDLVDPLEQVKL